MVMAVKAAGKGGKLAAAVLRTEDINALGLRLIKTPGGTPDPWVNTFHFETRLEFLREVSFSFRAEARRQFFNSIHSPQLLALARIEYAQQETRATPKPD
jgi:hypothetical protein